MSENLRLGVIVAIFALIGAGIFMMFSGGDDKQGDDKAATSNKANTSEALPDLDYAELNGTSDDNADLSADDGTPIDAEEEVADEDPANGKTITTVAGMTGPGTITGVITMHDGSALPPNVVVSLHYIHEQAASDPSIDTVLQTQTPNAKGEYTFEDLL